MSPEERELLETTRRLVADNNKILHSLRNSQRWQSFWTFVRWALIIGSTLGAYYYLQPYIDKILQLYGQLPDLHNLLPR